MRAFILAHRLSSVRYFVTGLIAVPDGPDVDASGPSDLSPPIPPSLPERLDWFWPIILPQKRSAVGAPSTESGNTGMNFQRGLKPVHIEPR